MNYRYRLSIAIVLLAIAVHQGVSQTPGIIPVATEAIDEYPISIVEGAEGEAIPLWMEDENNVMRMRAQRITQNGLFAWGDTGVAAFDFSPNHVYHSITSDQAGGAYVLRQLSSNDSYQIELQRIRSSGALWPASVLVNSDTFPPAWSTGPGVSIVTDGRAGAFIAWKKVSELPNSSILVQRVDSAGTLLWGNGIQVPGSSPTGTSPILVGDQTGGVIVIYNTYPAPGDHQLRAQRLGPDGSALWNPDIMIGSHTDVTLGRGISAIADGRGGVLTSWVGYLAGERSTIVQHVDSSGNLLWGQNGRALNLGGSVQGGLDVVQGAIRDVFVSWTSYYPSYDAIVIHCQRVDSTGIPMWQPGGISVDSTTAFARSISDGSGGILMIYGVGYPMGGLYCQRISPEGELRFGSGGVGITSIPTYYSGYFLHPVTPGKALAVFALDDRNVYAAFIDTSGVVTTDVRLSERPTTAILSQNYPNPFNPSTTISFALPSASFVSLKVFDALGREVAILESGNLAAGNHSREWNANGVANGVYFYRLQAGDFLRTRKMVLLK